MKAVLDTNVLFAGLRSRRGASYALLTLLRQKKWRLILSNTILAEYEEVLKRNLAALGLSPTAVDEFLDALCLLGEQQQLTKSWTPILPDPDDEAFAHLAAEAGADCLATFNLRHFIPLRQLGIPVLTPGEFLSKLQTIP